MSNIEKLKLIKDYNRSGVLHALARTSASNRFLFACSDYYIYDVDLGQAKAEFKVLGKHGAYATSVAAVKQIGVSGGYDGRLVWWDLEKRTQVRSIEAHAKWIRKVIASPDGKLIASVADDMVCRLWDV